MKAGQTALVLILLGAMATAGATADTSEGAGAIEIYFYSDDATALFFMKTAEPGDTLAEVLNGELPAVNYWYDTATGYEWPKDKPFSKDTYLRASQTKPPQEPAEETDSPYKDLLYIGLAGGAITAGIIIIGRRFA